MCSAVEDRMEVSNRKRLIGMLFLITGLVAAKMVGLSMLGNHERMETLVHPVNHYDFVKL